MKIETLKERIEKTKDKISKFSQTLERHQSQFVKKAKVLTDKGIDLNKYDKFDRKVIDIDTYWLLCDYEDKLEAVENTIEKINEATDSLEKLQEQLNSQMAKETENDSLIPESLITFLANWRQKCYEFYMALAGEYIRLLSKSHYEYEITEEELRKLTRMEYNRQLRSQVEKPKFSDFEIEAILNNNILDYDRENIKRDIRRHYIKCFENSHFKSDMMVVDKIIDLYEEYVINQDTLNKYLDEEVRDKKEMFIKRVKEVIGEIKDLSGLCIDARGEINGIAKGIKCNAKVETICAGGYHIQCFHFRMLVNVVR